MRRFLRLSALAVVAVVAACSSEDAGECRKDESSLLQMTPDGRPPVVLASRAEQPTDSPAEHVLDQSPEQTQQPQQPSWSSWLPGGDALRHRGDYYREHMGLHANGEGDLSAFLMALAVNCFVILVVIGVFSSLRLKYPEIYSNNVLGESPLVDMSKEERTDYLGWLWAARRILPSADHVEACVGLDHCMLLEYTNLAMKIMVIIGIPHIFVVMPLHRFYGGDAAAEDHLSAIGFANVEVGSPVCWVHGFVVWFAVCAAQHQIFNAQRGFVKRRIAWLKRMPFPRSNTILVECIEPEFRSDKKLKDYFNSVFDDDVVDSAYVVKETTNAATMVQILEDYKANLRVAEAEFRPAPEEDGPGPRPRHRVITDIQYLGQEVDTIEYYTEKVSVLEAELSAERARINEVVEEGGLDKSLYFGSGFVTFKKKVNCEHALKHNFSEDADSFVISIPPDPSDIRYPALQVDAALNSGREFLGYWGVAGVFFGFLPLVVAIASLTSLTNLRHVLPIFDYIVVTYPAVTSVWDGLMGSLLLTTLMGFVPTFLVMNFEAFFSVNAEAWMQHKVQQWYFYFLVLFVLLVTGIGSSLASVVKEVTQDPRSVFWHVSDTIPQTTHFYLNFMLAQWTAHICVLTRNAPLGKFLALKPLFGAARAKELAEPEDQAYYGIGSRSATFTLLLVMGIVFSTLTPMMCILCFCYFALSRLAHGSLFLFSETRKPDLGGVFWVTQLKHTQQGLFIYVLLMTGVLLHRAASKGPGLIALASLLFLIPSYIRFDRAFLWERLPFQSVHEDTHEKVDWAPRRKSAIGRASQSGTSCLPASYKQPELIDEETVSCLS